jgi:UDP-N-acetyl-D-galactosamine dehydrogenase
MASSPTISVIGLGYVGLPLAVALSRHFPVVGYDLNSRRVGDLRQGIDRSGEVAKGVLEATALVLTDRIEDSAGSNLFIITVPTPVDAANRPDLSVVESACSAVGRVIGPGAIVVLESTVYPGVTEEVCGPRIEAASGLVCGKDFFLGYSPERVNPGDHEHGIERITKVVAGQTAAVAATLEDVYGAVTGGRVFRARDIRTAEAAKVIENAQRDLNIAFMNELAMIFARLGLSTHDVLEAAGTKWNFLPFEPGLVGGHCIGVDPFYLAHCAEAAGHRPEIVLAGRRINDSMGEFVAGAVDAALKGGNGADNTAARILVLGLTFKENVPDLRNTKVGDLVAGLDARGHRVDVHDPIADRQEAESLYGIHLLTALDGASDYDCVIGAVPHDAYRAFTPEALGGLLKAGGLVADVKGMWRRLDLAQGFRRWTL